MEEKEVIVMDHPLIQHKISMLREKGRGTNEFRKLVEEIATMMGYEALRDLPLDGVLSLVPAAKVGHIVLYRYPVTHKPHEYYCKLPESIEDRLVMVLDPMLATGGSAVAAVDFVKKQGAKNIKFLCIIAAPEGIERFRKAHPDVQLYCGHVDRCLNDHAYICPGLGDAGDRIFGTK